MDEAGPKVSDLFQSFIHPFTALQIGRVHLRRLRLVRCRRVPFVSLLPVWGLTLCGL